MRVGLALPATKLFACARPEAVKSVPRLAVSGATLATDLRTARASVIPDAIVRSCIAGYPYPHNNYYYFYYYSCCYHLYNKD